MPSFPGASIIDVGNAAGNQLVNPDDHALSLTASVLRGPNRPLQDLTLLESFRHLAREEGSRKAVIDEDTVLSYETLNRKTNRLARLLQKNGVAPGVLVGVALQRSASLVESLLAVVKAGGAYVPLDPDYPEARLAHMLELAQPRVLITLGRFATRLPVSPKTTVLQLDASDELLEKETNDDFPSPAGPDDPLYVIFTSGSTGRPKGAIVHRRGFANLLEWFGGEFSIGREDRTLLLSSPSFDLTQKNFFAPLQTGGTLVCYPPGPFDLTKLAGLIERHGITIMNCTPSAFYPLADMIGNGTSLSSLRLAVLGGEPISIPRVRTWLEQPGRKEIANTYGPTECTDICGFYRLDRENMAAFSFVPLGKTIPNVQLAVINDELKPVPGGEAGELLIGGIGVGLGYLGDATRTAASFVPNPLPGLLEGPTAYRTGDRVRLLPGGVLEFLGRVDHQVKLRGYRIELPDIENTLAAHPSVREAAVVLVKTASDPVLTAFYILNDPAQPASPGELREFLASRLPEYMVPAKLVALEKFPLTPNGKVDRLQLATLEVIPVSALPSASGDIASAIDKLWSDVLGQNAIGHDDNFFDLGGNSIQLATIHARLIKLIGRPVPIIDLFAHPTIRSLAAHLEGNGGKSGADAINVRAQKQRQALAARRSTKS